jgi:hypothetical protein
MAELRRNGLAPWHGTGFLLLGGPTAVAALVLAILVTVGTIGTAVLGGGLLLLVAVPAARWLTGLQRRRTARWTGQPLAGLYSPAGGTLVTRVESLLRDPATWRDLVWLWVFAPIGVLGLLLCWVPWLAPRLAGFQAALSRSLLTPTARALRRAAQRDIGAPSNGHGLIGMRERVVVLGGTLRAGPLPGGGFEVVAELPLPVDLPADVPLEPRRTRRTPVEQDPG